MFLSLLLFLHEAADPSAPAHLLLQTLTEFPLCPIKRLTRRRIPQCYFDIVAQLPLSPNTVSRLILPLLTAIIRRHRLVQAPLFPFLRHLVAHTVGAGDQSVIARFKIALAGGEAAVVIVAEGGHLRIPRLLDLAERLVLCSAAAVHRDGLAVAPQAAAVALAATLQEGVRTLASCCCCCGSRSQASRRRTRRRSRARSSRRCGRGSGRTTGACRTAASGRTRRACVHASTIVEALHRVAADRCVHVRAAGVGTGCVVSPCAIGALVEPRVACRTVGCSVTLCLDLGGQQADRDEAGKEHCADEEV